MIRLQTLGEVLIEVGGVRLAPAATRAFATLLYLGVERDRRVSRASLQGLMFPGSSEANASHSLRQLLYRLRQMHVPVEAEGETVSLPAGRVTDDYSHLLLATRLTGEELDSIASGFLPSYAPTFSEPFTDWLDTFRTRVTLQLRRIVVAQLAELRRRGDWNEVQRGSRACLAMDALNEEGTLALAEALAMTGSKLQAIKLLDTYAGQVDSTERAMRLPASVLRARIAETFQEPTSPGTVGLPFVGRAAQLELALQRLQDAQGGIPQLIVLSGEQGIGKSRMSLECANNASILGYRSAVSRCRAHDQSRPLSVFASLLPDLMKLPGALGCSPASLQSLKRLADPSPNDRYGTDAEIVTSELSMAINDLIDALTNENPVFIAVDDAQFIDARSLDVLARVIVGNSALVVLLCDVGGTVLRRVTEQLTAEEALRRCSSIELTPLSDKEATIIVASALGEAHAADHNLVRWCVNRGAGNPLFLSEIARHQRWSSCRYSIPSALTELIHNRVESLDNTAVSTLAIVALLEPHATLERVRKALEVPTYELTRALHVLESRGFVTDTGTGISCGHGLIADSVLARIRTSARKLLCRAAATTLEECATDTDTTSLLWAAGELWAQAGDHERCVQTLKSCAHYSQALGQPTTAYQILSRARELTSNLSQIHLLTRDSVQIAVGACDWETVIAEADSFATQSLLLSTDGLDAEVTIARAVAELATGTDDDSTLLSLRTLLVSGSAQPIHRFDALRLLLIAADHRLSRSEALNAYRMGQDIPVSDSATLTGRTVAELLYHTAFGESARAIEAAHALLSRASKPADTHFDRLVVNVAFALYRLGEVREAELLLDQLYSRAGACHVHSEEHRTASILAAIKLDQGDLSEAESWCGRAAEAESRMATKYFISGHASNMIRLLLAKGNADHAEVVLRETLARFPASNRGRNALIARAYAARIDAMKGRHAMDHSAVEELVRSHLHARAFGMHDDIMVGVWYALTTIGETDRAIQLLDEYVSAFRRDRFPLAAELTTLVRDLTPSPNDPMLIPS